MPSRHSAVDLAKLAISITIILHILIANIIFAEELDSHHPQSSKSEDQATQSLLDSQTDSQRAPKIIHRIGTSTGKAKNNVSIKSTDAGLIHRQPRVSGCINCDVIDFVNKIGQGRSLNTIANGIVAGAVAGEVIRQIPYPYVPNYPTVLGTISSGQTGNIVYPASQHYIDVTTSDDERTIITLPDASPHIQRGDRFKLIEGPLAVDHQ